MASRGDPQFALTGNLTGKRIRLSAFKIPPGGGLEGAAAVRTWGRCRPMESAYTVRRVTVERLRRLDPVIWILSREG
jgi:hypothetical protein